MGHRERFRRQTLMTHCFLSLLLFRMMTFSLSRTMICGSPFDLAAQLADAVV
jgi:hypothetical protein